MPDSQSSEPPLSRVVGESDRRRPIIPEHELLGPIGAGGYGEVWLARNTIGNLRAVKLITRSHFETEEQYQREFAALEKVESVSRGHDGLVDILQIGRSKEPEGFYYVMELADALPGKSTDTAISRQGSQSFSARPLEQVGPAEEYVPHTLSAERKLTGKVPVDRAIRLAIQLCDGLAFLHGQGLVHCDLKPSNVIFVNGSPKLADFGLVTWIGHEHLRVGTDGFIPPEGPGQREGDVFSLGKVIYEITTGLPAWRYPELPADLVPSGQVSFSDLNRILLRACKARPEERIQTAEEFRRALQELENASVEALTRRVRWFRRAAITVGLMCLLLGVFATLKSRQDRERRERLESSLKEQKRQLNYQELVALERLRPRSTNWAENILDRLSQAAADATLNLEMRTKAVAAMHGLDARLRYTDRLSEVPSVAFSPDSREVLMGTTMGVKTISLSATMASGKESPLEARDLPFAKETALDRLVRYGPGGVPLAFSLLPSWRLQVTDLRDGRMLHGFNAFSAPLYTKRPNWVKLNTDSACAQLAVFAYFDDGSGRWAARSLAGGGANLEVAEKITAQAFSPDGMYLATGDERGEISLRTMADGKVIKTLKSESLAIKSLALQPVPLSPENARDPIEAYRLAAGDSGGVVTLWDLKNQVPFAHCRRYTLDVYALAFSPDASILAGAGRSGARLWDVASGETLLELGAGDFGIEIAFSSDGRFLAQARRERFTKGGFDLWELNDDRGLRTLRGLAGGFGRCCFSQDGTRIAASSVRGWAAVWDVASARWLASVQLPPQSYGSAADIALNPDGTLLATVGHSKVWVYDVASRRRVQELDIGPARWSALRFPASNQLLLIRYESAMPQTGEVPGEGRAICRLHNLKLDNWAEPILEIRDFSHFYLPLLLSLDGHTVFLAGRLAGFPEKRRAVRAYDVASKTLLWDVPVHADKPMPIYLTCDSDSRVVVHGTWSEDLNLGLVVVIDARTKEFIASVQGLPGAIGRDYWIYQDDSPTRRMSFLLRRRWVMSRSPASVPSIPRAASPLPLTPRARNWHGLARPIRFSLPTWQTSNGG